MYTLIFDTFFVCYDENILTFPLKVIEFISIKFKGLQPDFGCFQSDFRDFIIFVIYSLSNRNRFSLRVLQSVSRKNLNRKYFLINKTVYYPFYSGEITNKDISI